MALRWFLYFHILSFCFLIFRDLILRIESILLFAITYVHLNFKLLSDINISNVTPLLSVPKCILLGSIIASFKVLFTSFLSHNHYSGSRSKTLGVDDLDADQVLRVGFKTRNYVDGLLWILHLPTKE